MASLTEWARSIASATSAAKWGVRLVATSNLTLSGTQTIDGVAGAVGDRILVAGQTLPAQNGIYVMRSTAWVRADDCDQPHKVVLGMSVRVLEGTAYAGSTWALTSPTTGTVSLGVTSLAYELADRQDAVAESYEANLTVDRNAVITITGDDLDDEGALVLAYPQTGHVPGAEKLVVIPAGRLASSGMLRYASDLDPDGEWDAITVADPYVIASVAVTSSHVIARGIDLGARTTTTPAVDSATVDNDVAADELIVVHTVPVFYPNTTGLSLTGTSATITGIVSGNGTTTVVFQLSEAFNGDETANFVVGASRTGYSLNHVTALVATITEAIALDGFVYDYAAVPNGTAYWDPALDVTTATEGQPVSSWVDQINAHDWTAATTARPTYRASKGGMPALEYDAVANVMSGTFTIADLFNATTGYIAMVVWIDTIDASANNATVYLNQGLIADEVGYVGIFVKVDPEVRAYIFDGSVESGNANAVIATGGWTLVTMRWTGGNMYIGVDGVESAAEPLDAGITTLTDVMRLGRGPGAGLFLDGWIGKVICCDDDPGAPDRAALEASLMTEYGI